MGYRVWKYEGKELKNWIWEDVKEYEKEKVMWYK